MGEWVEFSKDSFKEIFTPNLKKINIDTRDFFYNFSEEKFVKDPNNYEQKNLEDINWGKLSKYPSRFFYTSEEVVEAISRLYIESGGKFEWRLLSLITNSTEFLHWNLKYIRIYKVEDSENLFIITNSYNHALKKEILMNSKINQELLMAH